MKIFNVFESIALINNILVTSIIERVALENSALSRQAMII